MPCDPLLRVLTGWLEVAGAEAVLCDPLLRVLTGWLWLAGADAVLCDPLARVATAVAVPAVWVEPCRPLAPVRARACPLCPVPAAATAEKPCDPRSLAPGS
ncbi:MAG TPA: hypothetical protein VFI66_06000 [Gemmatimonadales bacterium]|nr:hypothetical protein [Gemmatimonadales bacterium]